MFAALRYRFVLGLALVCAGGLIVGCTSSKTAAKDVKITACKSSPTGDHPTAQGTIKNNSSKSSAYLIHVKFKDSSGNGVGDGAATDAHDVSKSSRNASVARSYGGATSVIPSVYRSSVSPGASSTDVLTDWASAKAPSSVPGSPMVSVPPAARLRIASGCPPDAIC